MSDQPTPAVVRVEDWTDGDFDLDEQEICLDHAGLQTDGGSDRSAPSSDVDPEEDERPQGPIDDDSRDDSHGVDMYEEGFSEDAIQMQGSMEDEEDEEQTDTIKLSTAAGSALKLMLEASKEAKFNSAHAPFDLNDFEPTALDDLSDFQGSSHDSEDGQRAIRPASTSMSASTSTSFRSMLGLSTDLTEPDSPSSRGGSRKTSGSSRSAQGDYGTRSDLELSSEADESLEMDFELGEGVKKLQLCPSLSRARSHASLGPSGEDPWADESSSSSSFAQPPSFQSSVPTSEGSAPTDSSSNKHLSEESDADDEHEDMLDGLELAGSVFEAAEKAQGSGTAAEIKEKLEAILNLKRAGQRHNEMKKDANTTDGEADVAAGLVITDDLDLSASRISTKMMSVRGGRYNRSFNMPHRQASLPFTTSQSQVRPVHGDASSFSSCAPSGSRFLQRPVRSSSRLSNGEAADGQRGRTQDSSLGSNLSIQSRTSLRYKRSASDLHATNVGSKSAAKGHPQGSGSQLTRKRSLPSLQPSPPSSHNISSSTSGNREMRSGGSRLMASTAASRARAAETAADHLARLARDVAAPARPSTPVWIQPSHRTHLPAARIAVKTRSKTKQDELSRNHPGPTQPVACILKRNTHYGNGRELDEIEDLPGSSSPSSRFQARPDRPQRTGSSDTSASVNSTSRRPRRGGRKAAQNKPALIQPLGGLASTQKLVKGMRWNPHALRWEGNEDMLRDFDQVIQSSTRPALISQLTGSSTSSAFASMPGFASPISQESNLLMQNIASGVRVVGDMLFDPVQMRWIHKSGAEEEDPFAQVDENAAEGEEYDLVQFDTDGDNTIRARRIRSAEAFNRLTDPWARLSSETNDASSAFDRNSEFSNTDRVDSFIRKAVLKGTFPEGANIDRELWDACLEAEARHRVEVKGFLRPEPVSMSTRSRVRSENSDRSLTMEEIDRPRPHLYYLEQIAKSIARPSPNSSRSPATHSSQPSC